MITGPSRHDDHCNALPCYKCCHKLCCLPQADYKALDANKRTTFAYAGWVSREFETMVYDAFEAILDMPEVALLVADKMRSIGHDHSAVILERQIFRDKCNWKAFKRSKFEYARWAEGGRCSRPFESEQSSYAWSKRGAVMTYLNRSTLLPNPALRV